MVMMMMMMMNNDEWRLYFIVFMVFITITGGNVFSLFQPRWTNLYRLSSFPPIWGSVWGRWLTGSPELLPWPRARDLQLSHFAVWGKRVPPGKLTSNSIDGYRIRNYRIMYIYIYRYGTIPFPKHHVAYLDKFRGYTKHINVVCIDCYMCDLQIDRPVLILLAHS